MKKRILSTTEGLPILTFIFISKNDYTLKVFFRNKIKLNPTSPQTVDRKKTPK